MRQLFYQPPCLVLFRQSGSRSINRALSGEQDMNVKDVEIQVWWCGQFFHMISSIMGIDWLLALSW